jgi:hypothetical protein
MVLLPAASQLIVTSIVGGNGTLISRSHGRVTPLDEIEAKSGATTMWCPADATAVELGGPPRNG